MEWLIRWLRREAESSVGDAKSKMLTAIDAAQRYKADGQEATWDDMLGAIDSFLETRQRKHLDAVDEAGASGRL